MTFKSARFMFRCLFPVLAVLLLVGCGKKEPAPAGVASTASTRAGATASTSAGGNPLRDYMVPYLDDAKMAKFIESLQEEKNPFEMIFKGGMGNMAQLQKEMESFNAYARKYGFHGYEDYMAVWGRITVAEMSVAAQAMKQGAINMMLNMKKSAEEQLKRADLSAEMRQTYEQQIVDSDKSVADMQKPGKASLSEQDLAVYRKYKAQIDEVVKKFRK